MNKPAVKKVFKTIGLVLLGVLGVVVLLLLLLPLWIGPVVRPIANSTVSDLTQAKFNMGELGLNPYTGVLHVGDLQLSNPTNANYNAEENCFELGSLDVDVDMGTVLSKKIVITSIEVDGMTVRTTLAGGNFTQIAANAKGESVEEVETELEHPEENDDKDATRVQIDKIVLKNITVKYGIVPIPIPTLTIEGIGADKPEGASLADTSLIIWNKLLGAAGAVGGSLGDLGAGAADTAGKAADAIGEHAGKAVDAVKSLFK